LRHMLYCLARTYALASPGFVLLMSHAHILPFFFNDTATTEIYTLSLHDALPISSLMLLLVWLIFFMVLIKLLPILGTISGKTVKLMVLALICLGNNRQD